MMTSRFAVTLLGLLSATALTWSAAASAQQAATDPVAAGVPQTPTAAPSATPTQTAPDADATGADIVVTGTADRLGIRKLDASYSISSAAAARQVRYAGSRCVARSQRSVLVTGGGGECD